MTICASGESSALFLNSKSPMARDRARLPLTRPKSTKPPAAVMRDFSAKEAEGMNPPNRQFQILLPKVSVRQPLRCSPSSWGLWSCDRGLARPLIPRTPLESPALAYWKILADAAWTALGAGGEASEKALCGRGSERGETHDIDLVIVDEADAGGATRDLLFVAGICSGARRNQLSADLTGCARIFLLPLRIARSVARKPSFSACS